MELDFILIMHYILANQQEICLENGYHIETMNEGNKECLYITSIISGEKIVAEKLPTFSSGLYL